MMRGQCRRVALLSVCLIAGLGIAPVVAQVPAPQRAPASAMAAMQADAEAGNLRAKVMLGKAYLLGKEVERDDDKGVYWLRQAARQDDKVGQAWLGWAYEHGRALRKDPQRAFSWYQRSARQGYEWATQQAERLRASGLALGGARAPEQPVITRVPAAAPAAASSTPASSTPLSVIPARAAGVLPADPRVIAKQWQDWVAGQLQKQLPEQLSLEQAEPVSVQLAPPPELVQWLRDGIGVRVQADLQVDGAEVKAVTKPEQALRPNYPLDWAWEVRAKALGAPLLDLSLRARIVAPDSAPLRIELLRMGPRVVVEASWQQRLWQLVLDNRAAIGLTLLVPLFLWLGMSFAGRRNKAG